MFTCSSRAADIFVLAAVVLLAIAACAAFDPCLPAATGAPMGGPAVRGTISVGAPVGAGSVAVPPAGGTLTVSDPGSAVCGLTIVVPPGSYNDTRTFDVSSTPITGQTFGPGFRPVSPLIGIDDGGGSAGHLMLATIPIATDPGDFVMGFAYDDQKHALEGIPTVGRAPGSITVATSHFSNLVAAAVPPDAAAGPPGADSGFRPGVDDWQFVNYRTVANRGGQCVGQSLAEMYYYSEVNPPDKRPLYGLYDDNGRARTPGIQGDDTFAYRLCSLVQAACDDHNADYWREYIDTLDGWTDRQTFDEVRAAMRLTGEPQGLNIYSADQASGHMVVCYRVEGDRLCIADPNHPGQPRYITLADGQFRPYTSAETASDPDRIVYTKICYAGKTAMVPYSRLREFWDELDAGTVGDGLFPTYRVLFTFDMPDGTARTLAFDRVGKNDRVIDVPAPSGQFSVRIASEPAAGPPLQPRVFVGERRANGTQSFAVGDGGTRIGVEAWGSDDRGDPAWIGFGWFRVHPEGAGDARAPLPRPGAPGKLAPGPDLPKRLIPEVLRLVNGCLHRWRHSAPTLALPFPGAFYDGWPRP